MDAVVVSGLSKKFGTTFALQDVSISIPKGTIFGLLGPNGAGKTTLISILTGATTPTSGTVHILGKDAVNDRASVQQSMNMVRGFGGVLHGFRTHELLRYYALMYNVENIPAKIEQVMRRTGLWEQREKMVHEFSSGWRQRFFVAKALLSDPKILLLDEPTVGLDVDVAVHMRTLIKELKKEGMTILLTTHYMLEAQELCDRIALISQGKIVACGTVDELTAMVKKDEIVEIVGIVADPVRKEIAQIEGVLGVSELDGVLHVVVKHHTVMKDIMRALHASQVRTVRIKEITLEDTFLKLTHTGLLHDD